MSKSLRRGIYAGVLGASLILVAATVFLSSPTLSKECGVASWYGTESGNRTANGERFTGRDLTAAHKTMAFGTRLRVTYRGKSVAVRINDRGPYIRGRVIDLSSASADQIGLKAAGVATVCWEVIGRTQ